MPNIIALIPARSGSKTVPHKNIRYLGGHELLSWSIKSCLKTHLISRTIVSTDSEAYAEIALTAGAEVPFLRPAEISQDSSTDFEFIKHALDRLSEDDRIPDYIVHIRPTTPFRDPAVIDHAIKYFIESSGYSCLRSVHKMSESAYKTFEISQSGALQPLFGIHADIDTLNGPRQSFPDTYSANGYVDVLSTDVILKTGMIHGQNVLPLVTENIVECDTEEDFNYLQFQLSQSQDLISEIFS